MSSLHRLQRERPLPAWRSIHFVPANVAKFIAKAPTLGADAIQIDLEDSVPAHEKAGARATLRATAAQVRSCGADVIVRVNRALSLAVRDIEAAVCRDVDAVTITKVDGASHIRLIDELVTECEAREGLSLGHVKMIAVVETPDAFDCMKEIAAASPRVVALMLGSEDFALECGAEPIDEVLLQPKQRMVIAARAAGVLPLGYIGTIADFRDVDAFRAMVRRSRRYGFEGGTSIHPSQIAVLNEEYSPRPEDIEYARRVVEENAAACAAGRGSFQIDGKMIDVPVVQRAERLLEKLARLAK